MDAAVEAPTKKLLFGNNSRVAVQLSANESYHYLLRVTESGIVDVERVTATAFQDMGWRESRDPLGPWKWANTYAKSTLMKTQRAARLIQEIKMEQQEQNAANEGEKQEEASKSTPSMADLVAEYKRLTGKEIKSFKSKAAGIAAIEKISKLANVSAPAEVSPAPTEKENVVARKKRTKGSKRTNGAATDRAPRAKGIGAKAVIRELFRRKGTKLTLKEIQKACGREIATSTVITSISDLKNPKYAGAEGTMVLSREVTDDGDVLYKRVE